jgi:hypothetical protein
MKTINLPELHPRAGAALPGLLMMTALAHADL